VRYMVKVNSRAVSFRLKEEARWALEDLAERWGLTQTAAVERAIRDAHGGGDVVDRTTGEVLREAVSVQYVDPTTKPGVSRGMPEKREEARAAAFQVLCQHCGKKFGAESRRETTCAECGEKEHRGTRYDCETCREDNVT